MANAPRYRRNRDNFWRAHWHPWYGYTNYFRRPWWNPYCSTAYFPSYYFGYHGRHFRFGLGFDGLFGSWRGYSRWCYPRGGRWGLGAWGAWGSGFGGCVGYPYYTRLLTYPYYRYVYVGSGPANVYCASNDYYDPVVEPIDYEPVDLLGALEIDETVAGEPIAVAGRTLPEAAPPATARVVSGDEFFLRLGDAAFARGAFAEAIKAYRQAIDAAPEAAAPHFALAEALIATGDYQFAAFSVRQGLERDAQWLDSGLDRRILYRDDAAYGAIDAKLAEYVQAKPFDVAGHFALGYARYFSKERASARPSFEEVLRLNPNDRDAMSFLKRFEKTADN